MGTSKRNFNKVSRMLTCGKDLSLGKGASQSVMTDKTLASTNAKRKSILDMDVLTVLSMANFLVAGSPCKIR